MSQAASLRNSVGQRYAAALFEIAKEASSVDSTEEELSGFGRASNESEALQAFLASPLYSRDELGRAISAIAEKYGLSQASTSTIKLMTSKGRLHALPSMIAAFEALAAEYRQEVTAEVRAAQELSSDQLDALKSAIKNKIGKDVAIDVQVDNALLGGMVVKVGSLMIDSSLAGKLSKIHNAMKEVG